MRIALVTDLASIHSRRWAGALSARGHDVHLVTFPGAEVPLKNVVVHSLRFGRPSGYLLNVFELRSLLRWLRPEIVHYHYASGNGTLARLVNHHPYILSVWGSDVFEFPQRSPLHKRSIIRNLRAADWICSTSRMMARQVQKLCPQVKGLTLTPFGVDLDQFSPSGLVIQQDRVVIGTMKHLRREYGIDTLIQAFARARAIATKVLQPAPTLRLVIGGAGPEQAALQRLCQREGIASQTVFLGSIPHNDVPGVLGSMQIFVALSRCEESFGVSVVEAEACGLPVVVSDAGGLEEVVDAGTTGYVVPRDDPERAAEALVRLISEPELRGRLGTNGRARVQKHYDWEKNVSIMENLYSEFALNHMGLKSAVI